MDISDILIHIDQVLDAGEKYALEERLRAIPGVIAPRFNPGQDHLLLVAYNPAQARLAAMLDSVLRSGYRAQLIGG